MIRETTPDTYAEVEKSSQCVLVFHADMCSGCQIAKPILVSLHEKHAGSIDMFFVDVQKLDINQPLVDMHHMEYSPTVIFLAFGKEIGERFVGYQYQTLEDYEKELHKNFIV